MADSEKPAEQSRDAFELNDDSAQDREDIVDSTHPSTDGEAEDEGPMAIGTEKSAAWLALTPRDTNVGRHRVQYASQGRPGVERSRHSEPASRAGEEGADGTCPVRSESIGELRKVVYPTGQQVLQYFVVVLVFVLFVIAYNPACWTLASARQYSRSSPNDPFSAKVTEIPTCLTPTQPSIRRDQAESVEGPSRSPESIPMSLPT